MRLIYNVLIISLLIFVCTSCGEEDEIIPTSSNAVVLPGVVPNDFTKKVILEKNTGEWCGWCPYGAEIMTDIVNANSSKVIGIAIHDRDPLEVSSYNSFQKNLTRVGGFPSGSINRANAIGRNSWNTAIKRQLAKSTNVGLALESRNENDLLNIDVYIGYNEIITEQIKLTLLITENGVTQSAPNAQSVYKTSGTGNLSPLPSNWKHSYVLRGVVTNHVSGDTLSLDTAANFTKISYPNIDLTGYGINNTSNAQVVAFVHSLGATRKVLNAQQVKLFGIKDWN